jgi:L-ascorbate metabolism protein UlaG (beta-lactamase superfamily)
VSLKPLLGASLAAAVGLSLGIQAQSFSTPSALKARFIGRMALAITDGTVTLMSDFPYEQGYDRSDAYDMRELEAATTPTLALVTHRHRDHWEPGLFARTGWKVIAPRDATEGLPQDRVLPLSRSIAFEGIVVEPIVTPHANIGHHSYVVTWRGKRLYFSGDTESVDHLTHLENIDVAFMSSWLYGTTQRSGRRVEAKRIVIYHRYPGERPPAACTGTCSAPAQGDTFVIE